MIKVLRSPAVIISLSLRFSVTFCEPITCRVLVESISIYTDEISIYIDIILFVWKWFRPEKWIFSWSGRLNFQWLWSPKSKFKKSRFRKIIIFSYSTLENSSKMKSSIWNPDGGSLRPFTKIIIGYTNVILEPKTSSF